MRQDILKESDRRRIALFVEGRTGIQLPSSKHALIEARIRKRQRELGLDTIRDYVEFVFHHPAGEKEQIALVDAMTTNKTGFFREPEHFTFLQEKLESILNENPNSYRQYPLTVWSAGCSTGEEPYTMALVFSEMQRHFPNFNFRIIATDISARCLEKSKKGIYDHDKIEPIPFILRKRYLLRSKTTKQDLVCFSKEIKQNIQFKSLNLLSDQFGPSDRFDIIFCRNVMIYFSQAHRKATIDQFGRVLKPGGWLFFGHSESLHGRVSAFRKVKPTVYEKQYRN